MYSIKLDVNDNIYDKIMFFLNNVSKDDLKIKEIKNIPKSTNENLADFFQNSPLLDELDLTRESEQYSNRVEF